MARILASGEAHPDDRAGPDDLPALVFSLANDQLKNKTEIVKTLLSHGADPSVVEHLVSLDEGDEQQDSSFSEFPLSQKIKEGMNPAIRFASPACVMRPYLSASLDTTSAGKSILPRPSSNFYKTVRSTPFFVLAFVSWDRIEFSMNSFAP